MNLSVEANQQKKGWMSHRERLRTAAIMDLHVVVIISQTHGRRERMNSLASSLVVFVVIYACTQFHSTCFHKATLK
jgi:hypothetical protein